MDHVAIGKPAPESNPAPSGLFVAPPRVEWEEGQPYCVSQLSADYAAMLEKLAHGKEEEIRKLPVFPGWETAADTSPTTSRFGSYCAFLLGPETHPLYFAIRETYRELLRVLGRPREQMMIQCWYNIHRVGASLPRHAHAYPFIGTFSCHSEGSVTRYGRTREASDTDVLMTHTNGQLMVTTGPGLYHETSPWIESDRPRVTYAFDITQSTRWNPAQIFVPFDTDL